MQFLTKHTWLTFVLPLAVYLLVGSLEPTPPQPDKPAAWPAIPYRFYPAVYTAKLLLTVVAVGLVLPGYRQFPFRLTPLAFLVGIAGAVAWIGLCELQRGLFPPDGIPTALPSWLNSGGRSAYDPFRELAAKPASWAWGFLAIRFMGLVVIVPIIEEFFLRGFLMRFFVRTDWPSVPFGEVNTTAVLVGALYPLLSHPANEWLAGLVWFSLVTLLMVKTRSIWDCIAAHAITNLLLGVYVVHFDRWYLM
jgi:uncharacterized protein